MGTTATSDLELQRSQLLTMEQSAYAVHVASGCTYREAARRAGINPENAYRLKDIPTVRLRIQELIDANSREELGSIASRAWIETQLVSMCNSIDEREKPEEFLDLARLKLQVLMSLARLKGMIIEKKQTASVHISSAVGQDSMQAHLSEYLDALEPGARKRIEARVKRLTERATPQPVVVDAKAQPTKP